MRGNYTLDIRLERCVRCGIRGPPNDGFFSQEEDNSRSRLEEWNCGAFYRQVVNLDLDLDTLKYCTNGGTTYAEVAERTQIEEKVEGVQVDVCAEMYLGFFFLQETRK